ncbi:putative E3 ubiquitin-protein ligase RZFP34 [Camellia lanceoleosa]|uniref:E3 ubiquitin-protein ligase RZFP34 n=1 Tax=Camellia lanceoleosa TaxID=1840588 RepID=A0ACC0G7M9_9ERIC|nr:putative E3 ubiquitin-protein ligase RZFP34 [Camellia lanceoleosa]
MKLITADELMDDGEYEEILEDMREEGEKFGCCYSVLLKNSHPCVEGAMHNDCPVCFEYLFESRNDVTVMPCGHTIHGSCLKDMHEHYRSGSSVMTVEPNQKCSFT